MSEPGALGAAETNPRIATARLRGWKIKKARRLIVSQRAKKDFSMYNLSNSNSKCKLQPCPVCQRTDAGCMGFSDLSGGLCFGRGSPCPCCGDIVPIVYGNDAEARDWWRRLYCKTNASDLPHDRQKHRPTRREKLRARAGRRKVLNQAAKGAVHLPILAIKQGNV